MSKRADAVQFDAKRDGHGYWTSTDGRWKAKEHPVKGRRAPAVTLTDTTRRAIFADTGASWIRVASWDEVRATIAAHRD